jgi:hypothetical protein
MLEPFHTNDGFPKSWRFNKCCRCIRILVRAERSSSSRSIPGSSACTILKAFSVWGHRLRELLQLQAIFQCAHAPSLITLRLVGAAPHAAPEKSTATRSVSKALHQLFHRKQAFSERISRLAIFCAPDGQLLRVRSCGADWDRGQNTAKQHRADAYSGR